MRISSIFYLLFLVLVSPVALAVAVPTASPHDERVRTVEFNPDDVVRLDGMVGALC